MEKLKAHTIYRLADGTIVPSVTTVLTVLAKPGLINWANRMGLQGIDCTKARDHAGDVGSLAHALIASLVKKEEFSLDEYSPVERIKALKCLEGFRSWWERQMEVPVLVETSLISEEYQYGGTIDLLLGKKLVDFKTSNAFHEEYDYQVAAYVHLLKENNYAVDQVEIVKLDKDTGKYELRVLDAENLQKEFTIFLHCLEIYKLRGGI